MHGPAFVILHQSTDPRLYQPKDLSVCLQLCDGSSVWVCLCHHTSKHKLSILSPRRYVCLSTCNSLTVLKHGPAFVIIHRVYRPLEDLSVCLSVCNSVTVPKHGPAFVRLHQSTDLSLYRPTDLGARPYRRTMNNRSVSFSPGQSSQTVPLVITEERTMGVYSPVQCVPTLGLQWWFSQVRTRVNTLLIPPCLKPLCQPFRAPVLGN